jgi:hypothetical protein
MLAKRGASRFITGTTSFPSGTAAWTKIILDVDHDQHVGVADDHLSAHLCASGSSGWF